jgi:transcriptional regulator with GAF, ATPase, and Fis domain
MNIDEKEFFREATLRICGSLEIEKALCQCLLYIRQFMPADLLAFHVYDSRIGVLDTIALATVEGGQAMSMRIPLPPEVRTSLEEGHQEQVRVVGSWAEDEVGKLVLPCMPEECGSGIVLQLTVEGEMVGALDVSSYAENQFTQGHAHLVALLNDPFAIALANSLRYRQVLELKELLTDDKQYLQDELRKAVGEEIIGADFGLKGVMDLVRHVAPLKSPVLLLGETGTGKEVIAGAIHSYSPRKEGPFIKVNCGAIPGTLMDSELFGHEKGAFTGAISLKRGRFERAHEGTIFLDEIGELTAEAQIRLLRVLQEKEIERVGGTDPIEVDIRVIAATHRDLERMVQEDKFREDLYFRLKVFPIAIPPLRERMLDIPTLIQHFMRKKSLEMGRRSIPTLAPGAVDQLMSYHWPGNVRELENAVERALILSDGHPLSFTDLNVSGMKAVLRVNSDQSDELLKLDEVVFGHIRKVLDMTGGRVEGEGGAAQVLGVNPSTLRQRMRKLGIPFGRKAKNYYKGE